MKPRIFLALLIAITAVACSEKKEEVRQEGLDLTVMDTTVRVQDDLFLHANGGWLRKTNIPADQGGWGSFHELWEESQHSLLDILKRTSTSDKYAEGSDQKKAADFYAIGMDSLLAEKAGNNVLKPFMAIIDGMKDKSQITSYLSEDAMTGGDVFLTPYIDSDAKDSSKPVFWMYPSGLGLPERDYYLKSDDKSKEVRARYLQHTANMFTLYGESTEQAKKNADVVLKIETQLAKAMMTKEESRDPQKTYHPMNVTAVAKMMPSVGLDAYLKALNVTEDTLIVSDPGYFKEFEKVISSAKLDDIKTYLKITLLRKSAPYLNHAFVQERFDFNQKYMNGVEELRPRWKRVMAATDDAMGEAIGKLYVDEKFPPEAKQKALEMVENIKLAFADRINKLEWMSDSTKQKALKKLSTFSVKIGYPDNWKDYAALTVDKDPEKASYFDNVMNATRFETKRDIAKLGKKADKTEWFMTPQTINAYYNPSFNEIVFPAAILQPPFYNYKADDAVNYGAIGAVIGHEISHGFDDSGSQFDGDGNLVNWWSEKDLGQFKDKGKALASQFSKFEAIPGVFVNGEFTLGENIGDLGGLCVAYDALQKYLKDHGRPGLIDGYTPEQRFFLSWATAWRSKYRDESVRTQVQTDPHSPDKFRANASPSNMPEFYKAFNVKSGDKMYREDADRVKIW